VGRPTRLFLGRRSHRTERSVQRASRSEGRVRDDRGLSIIEVVVAFSILLIVLVPVALLLSNTIGQAASSRERLTALSLAEQYLDLLNNTPVQSGTATANRALKTTNNPTLPKTGKTIEVVSSVVRSTVHYSVYAEFTWALHESTTPDLCDAKTAPTLLDLQVTVEWGHEPQKISDTTLINFPSTGIVTEGFLAIKVDGDPSAGPPADAHAHAWTTRVQAVPVTIAAQATVTGFTTITRYPNQYGCVFQEVPAGKFTVTVADPSPGTPPGTNYGTPSWASSYDELTRQTSPTPAKVTVDSVTTMTFGYDEGAFVKLTYPSTTAADGIVACPGAGSILCMAAGQSPTSATAPSSTPRADLTVLTSSGWTLYQPSATGLEASACAKTTRCIAVGYKRTGGGYVGASVSTATGTIHFTSDTVPAGVVSLSAITCPTASRCFAYGQGTGGGAILTASVGTGPLTWHLVTGATGVSVVHSLTCLSSTTTCYAAATTSSTKAEILSATSATPGKWGPDTLPTSPKAVIAVSELACGTSSCFSLASSSTAALVLSLSSSSPTTWVEDTVRTVPASLTSIACPSASHCYAIGKASSTVPAVVSLVVHTSTTTTWARDSIKTASVTSLSLLQCPAKSTCYAAGATASGPAIVSLYASTTTWNADGLPTGLGSITALTCPTTSQCAAVATKTTPAGAAVISLDSTGVKWTSDTLPTSPAFLAGIACSSARSKCATAGATASAATFVSATLSGTTWRAGTPGALVGMYLSDTPISVYNAGLTPTTTVEVASPTPSNGDVGSIGPLFPFATGYQVAAAGCAAEVTSTAPSVSSVPGTGATTGSVPTAALSMGLLPVEVESAAGATVSGASVTIKPTCTRLSPPTSETNQASFSLGATGATGVSSMAVMYGTYTVTVKSGATTASATVTVSRTSLTVGAATVYLPTPVVVKL
jgi:Tfp pilus assembly protein PilV